MGFMQQGRPNMVQQQQGVQQQQQQPRHMMVQNQQVQQLHPMGSPCPASPQVLGPAQSPRGPGMPQSSPSPMGMATPTTPQPSPSPVQRVVAQQRPMPAPSPMMQQHHSPITPGGASGGQQMCNSSASPMPSPSPAGHHSVLSSISSPRGMGQHGQVGTPLSQHSSAEGETGGLNSPFSPGPMASPQPVMAVSGPHSGGMVRLTSPQTHPPRLPSPQQPQHVQQVQQQQQQMGMPVGVGQQQQQNMTVRMIRPQMGQHPHMVIFRFFINYFISNFLLFFSF